MGTVISKAANGIGGALGNAFVAPIKTIFGDSCEGVCAGTWDITCFIEHLCVSNLVKLFLVLGLCYITLLFFYLMFKLGIFQCIGRSLCKMCYAACETYWHALKYITCFLWYKLKNTKRVNRRRRRERFKDFELGHYSSDTSDSSNNYQSLSFSRKRKSFKMRGNDHDLDHDHDHDHVHPHDHHHHHHHHMESKTREVSLHVKRGSRKARSSRQLQGKKVRNLRREATMCKKRKLMR